MGSTKCKGGSLQDVLQLNQIHTLGPSMPQVAFTPLGLPSLAI
jgi:hypothetical protein